MAKWINRPVAGVALSAAVALASVLTAPGHAQDRHAQDQHAQAGHAHPAGTSAAADYDWGQPAWADEFDGSALGADWFPYTGAGNGGNGIRDPKQISVADGVLTQTGTADGTSAGMLLRHHDERFGRWEIRMRAFGTGSGGGPYHPVGAFIPQGVDYHCGERDLDFFEKNIDEPEVALFIHHAPGKQDYGFARTDAAQWHTYAVEIAHDHITWFVDGSPVLTDPHADALPEYPTAVNFQLDANQPDGLNPAQLQVDYTRFYPLPEGTVPTPQAPEPEYGDYPAC